MRTLWAQLKTSALLTLVLALLLGGAFPLLVWGLGEALFPFQANGSLVVGPDGAVRGSALLGQNFVGDGYFQPRPSAAGTGYDATNSGGTNLGPTSKKLADGIGAALAAYRKANGLAAGAAVPADAVTSSGSGLDPDISPANAAIQAVRVAKARGLPVETVRALVARHTDGRGLGVFGEPRVNVLLLNLDLDRTAGSAGR